MRTRRIKTSVVIAATAALACLGAMVPALSTPAAASVSAASVSALAGEPATLPAPPGNAFYDPPSPLPAGRPGDIIWYRASPAPGVLGARAWQILYLSRNARNQPIAVSGTVFVPTAGYDGVRPVVAYASGTQGWGPQCVPSREIARGDFDEQFAVDGLLSRGWAVVVTDEPGEGTPGPQLYTVGIAEGHAVLDSLRAALALPGAGLSAHAPVGVEGYSQGGGAAGWAAELHRSYAPGLNLKGVAMGGTPANLQAVASNIDGSAFFAFLGGAAIGFGAAYPSLHLDSYLNAAGKRAFARLRTMCQVQGLVAFAFRRIQDYTKNGQNPMMLPAFEKALDENDLGAIKPDVPVLQTHGLFDEVIPYRVEVNLHNQWCTMGVKSELDTFPGEHVTTAVEDQPLVIGWLAGRFAGQPAPSNC